MLLIFLLALIVAAALTAITTVGTNLTALTSLVAAPAQLQLLVRDGQARQNLALAHATINVIGERHGLTGLAGLVQPGGFVIRGGAPPSVVASSASEALARLRAGERRLAGDPRCAPSLLAAELALTAAVVVALLVSHVFGLASLIAGLAVVTLLAPRLSPLLQRRLTTDASVGTLAITAVELETPSDLRGIVALVALAPVLVHTSAAAAGARVGRAAGPREEIPVEDYRVR